MKPIWSFVPFMKNSIKSSFMNPSIKKHVTFKCPSLNCYCVRNCFRCETIIYLCNDMVRVKDYHYYCKYCRDLVD